MQSGEALLQRFEKRLSSRPMSSAAEINDDGLVFGAGIILARMTRDPFGSPIIALEKDKDRLLALLAAAYGRQTSSDVLRHVEGASDYWRRGEKALANIRSAFTGLPRLEDRGGAYRLFLAEELLEKGMSPQSLMTALGLDEARGELIKRYSLDQPRVPAGSPQGGQWTSEGGGAAPQVQVAINVDPNVASDADASILPAGASDLVDLSEEESNGAHTIDEHVGKSDKYLLRRVQDSRFQIGPFGLTPRVGSFPSLQAAEKLVNSTISQNQDVVDQVASGDLDVKRINAWFKSSTGKEAYAPSARAKPEIRDTWGIAVVLRHDPTARRGFRVISAYPIN
jgi:hypothetical protein